MRHRPSSIRTYQLCALRSFKEYYEEGRAPQPHVEDYDVGNALHAIAEITLKEKAGLKPKSGLLKTFSHDVIQEAEAIFRAALPTILDNMPPISTAKYIEETLTMEDGLGRTLFATPDVVFLYKTDEGKEVCDVDDWKTAYTEQGYEMDQLLMYCGILKGLHPNIDKFNLRVHFVRLGYAKKMEVDASEAVKALARAWEVIESIETEDIWQATAGHHCTYCRVDCPLPETALKMAAVRKHEDALFLTNKIIASEAALKKEKAMLKEWCSVMGPVHVTSGYYGFKDSPKTSYKPQEIYDDIGDGFWDFASVSSTAIKKYIKSNPGEISDAHMIHKPQQKFSLHKEK